MSAFGGKADMAIALRNVRQSGHAANSAICYRPRGSRDRPRNVGFVEAIMTRRVFRAIPTMSLITASLIFSYADNVEAKSGGGSGQQSQSGQSKNTRPINFKAKWGRAAQNINTHNTATAQQTKSVGTSSIMKTKHDTVKNPISNIR
jgi:hypothetical protein